MATEKKIKGVIIPRHDIAKNWAKAVNFVPSDGELIIFSKDSDTDIARGYYLDDKGNPLSSITINGQSYPVVPSDKVRFKFGNNIDNVNVLPFATTDTDLTGYATEDWVKAYVAQNGGSGNGYASVTERRIVSGSEVELTDICPIQSDIVLKTLKDGQPQANVEVQFYDSTNVIYDTVVSDINGNIPSESIQYPYTKLKVVDTQYTIHGEYDAILDVESLDVIIDSKIEAAMEDYQPESIETKPGLKTIEGGEIFNDYVNNQAISSLSTASGYNTLAGSKVFIIQEGAETGADEVGGPGQYELDSIEGLEVGDVYSLYTDGNYENVGKITGFETHYDEDGVTLIYIVRVDTYYAIRSGTENHFRILSKPLCGTKIVGTAANAEGYSTKAELAGAHAEGYNTIAGGKYSHAEGHSTQAGYASHAEGWKTEATGHATHSEGYNTKALGFNSHAEGESTQSLGRQSHAEGKNTVASGVNAHAEGQNTVASGGTSHAEGGGNSQEEQTVANGNYSHAEGFNTFTDNLASHSEGYKTSSSGVGSHSEGRDTIASGEASHSEGKKTSASGIGSHSEGRRTVASGDASHAEGTSTNVAPDFDNTTQTTIISSWNSNKFSLAEGENSHVEGEDSLALASNSHAEGYHSKALGHASHAEGSSIASGSFAHSEGENSTASGSNSHAEGTSTTIAPDFKSGLASQSSNIISSWDETKFSLAKGENSHVEGQDNLALGLNSHAEGYQTKAVEQASHAEGNRTTAQGLYSHAEGTLSTAHAASSHAEGYNTSAGAQYSHAEGKDTETHGQYSHAEGNNTKANSNGSHAEGSNVDVTGNNAHGEGYNNIILNSSAAHIEGLTNQIGTGSIGTHVEGEGNQAIGRNIHVGGFKNIAKTRYQTVIGKYNDNQTNTLFEIGDGSADDARSNAFVVRNDGSAELRTQGESDNSVVINKTLNDKISTINSQITTLQSAHLIRKIVDVLPDINSNEAKPNVVYMVPKEDSNISNVYNEYMFIEGNNELIGERSSGVTNFYYSGSRFAFDEEGNRIVLQGGGLIASDEITAGPDSATSPFKFKCTATEAISLSDSSMKFTFKVNEIFIGTDWVDWYIPQEETTISLIWPQGSADSYIGNLISSGEYANNDRYIFEVEYTFGDAVMDDSGLNVTSNTGTANIVLKDITESTFELIGDTSIDLSDYTTKSELSAGLNNKLDSTSIQMGTEAPPETAPVGTIYFQYGE